MRYWRLTPGAWGRESFEARAEMLAFMLFEHTRESYRMDWKAAHKDGKGAASDESTFAAMRHRMRLKAE